MKPNKLLLFTVLSLIFLMTSCSKDSTNVNPLPPPPSIVGEWNLVSQTDTLFYSPPVGNITVTNSSNFYGSIKFESNGTVYTTTSFLVGFALNGNTIYFVPQLIHPVKTDTSKYTISNNIVTITSKYGTSFKDTIAVIDDKKLVLSRFTTDIHKKTQYYSK